MKQIEVRIDPAKPSFSFLVENECEWLSLSFSCDEQRTWGEMRLTDPEGRVRFTYMNVYSPREVLIHESKEKSSYLGVPGAIGAGEWRLEWLRVPPERLVLEWETGQGETFPRSLSPAAPRSYWTVGAGARTGFELDLYPWREVRETGERSYRGDLHGHTLLSDGKMTPEQTMEQAERRGLDFFFVTEHNLLPCSWPVGRVLVIPGMEFTSYGRGDWNALGLTRWLDGWGLDGGEAGDGGVKTAAGQLRLMKEAAQLGAIRSLNHPLHGRLAWRYPELPLDQLDTIEIWNSPTQSNRPALTEQMLRLWDALWREGYRIPGVGGSDAHLPPNESYEEGGEKVTIGDPSTSVYAEQLSPEAILRGIRAGHAYVSRGPTAEAVFICGGRHYRYGDDLTDALNADRDRTVRCNLEVAQAFGCRLVVLENGVPVRESEIGAAGRRSFELAFTWPPEQPYTWLRFELRTSEGRLAAFTNPVSYGAATPGIRTWGELLEQCGIPVEGNSY